MLKLSGSLFGLQVGDQLHSILQTHVATSEDANSSNDMKSKSYFNLVMIDVSGSMSEYWPGIIADWNAYIAPQLKGFTKIYVFGNDVEFRRNGIILEESDFLCEGTNLTEAITAINSEVHKCQEELVRVFLFTDGEHNATEICPSVEISKLSIPPGKTIEVFLLGIGDHFPVEFSINIRSNLHNGNSNVPSLFWVKFEPNISPEELLPPITLEILNIVDVLITKNVKVNLSLPGYLVPGSPETTCVYTNEYIYFTHSPTQISSMHLSLEDESNINFELSHKVLTIKELLNAFFQWNSLVIQYHKKKGKTLTQALEVMDTIYKNFHERLHADLDTIEKDSLKYRLARKELKFLETEFTTLMNKSKVIIGLDKKYLSDAEYAENILKTTVRSKYFYKNLKYKGHSSEDYVADCQQFLEIYESIKEKILALPEPSPDECCRVTMGSTVKDLCDPMFLELLNKDKYTFLKIFTITGLPIYAPIRDPSQINPWALCIKNILNSPYDIISQSTLELSAEFGTTPDLCDKDVFLQEGDENSRFNAIIPVFSHEVMKVLQPLIRTNLFAMLATFCILKDPHIIDHNAHLAALGCAWMKLLMDYPSQKNRPQFIIEKLGLIQATGEAYLARGGIVKYLKVLLDEPDQALMTESITEYGQKTLHCETLIKPMFLLYLNRENPSTIAMAATILPLLILEFIGRCLDNFYRVRGSLSTCLYTSFFVPSLSSREDQEKWFEKKSEEISMMVLESFTKNLNGSLVQNYFTLEDLQKSLKLFYRQQSKKMRTDIFELGVNQKMLMSLKNKSSAGNIKFSSLKIFAEEMSLPENVINDSFAEQKIFISTFHCLKHNWSRGRLAALPLPNYDDALEKVKQTVINEHFARFRKMARKKVLTKGEKLWHQEFMLIHGTQAVKPMSPKNIVETASKMGIAVNKSTFDQIYRYNIKNGLLRNACMIRKCPFYLRPRRTFNQHISISRKRDGFIHQLHRIASEVSQKDGTVEDVIQAISKGYDSMNGRKLPPTPSTVHLNAQQTVICDLMKEYKVFT